MKPDVESKLKTFVERKQKEKQDATMSAAKREREVAKNDSDLTELKEKVIKPALQEIVTMLQAKEIPIWLVETEQEYNRHGGSTPAAIGLEVLERRSASGNMTPEFKFMFRKGDRKLSLYTSTRSEGGPGQDVLFEEVTAEWIQGKFAEFSERL